MSPRNVSPSPERVQSRVAPRRGGRSKGRPEILSSGDGDSDFMSGIEDMDDALEVLRADDTSDFAMMDLAIRAGLTYKFVSYQYLSRLFAAASFCFVAAYINTLASVCAGYRTPWLLVRDLDGKETPQRTLPDLGHDIVEMIALWSGAKTKYIDNYALPDELVYALFVASFALIALHPQRFMILRRMLFLFGMMFLLRAVTVSVTQLPDASPTCQAQFGDPRRGAYKRQPMFPKAFHRAWVFLLDPRRHVTCGDMLFSGHTTCLTMCGMLFKYYCKARLLNTKVFFRWVRGNRDSRFASLVSVARYSVYLYCSVGSMLIVATRLHYTLDVVVAIIMTYSVFTWYHTWLRYGRLKERGWVLLRWFEAEEVLRIEHWAFRRARNKAKES